LTDRPVYNNHPTILLAKCSHLVIHQNEFIQTLSQMVDLNQKWIGIAYNGNGILMYNRSFKHNIIFDKFVGKYMGYGTVSFKGMGIMSALSYVKKYWKEQCSRIVIVAGNLANRCINFMDSEYEWHITDEYLDPSETAQCVDLIQSLRICGIHKSEYTTPLKVWCNLNIQENIVKTYTNVGEFIVKAAENHPNTDFQEMLSGVKIHKEKLGNRKICKASAPYKKVSNVKQDNTNSFTGGDTKTNYATDNEEIKIQNGQIIWIDETKLQNAPKQLATYKDTIEMIANKFGTGIWVERGKISKALNDIYTEHVNTQVLLVHISKHSEIIVDENYNGMLMKKVNNIVYIRLN
jgi:hypothetical protein